MRMTRRRCWDYSGAGKSPSIAERQSHNFEYTGVMLAPQTSDAVVILLSSISIAEREQSIRVEKSRLAELDVFFCK